MTSLTHPARAFKRTLNYWIDRYQTFAFHTMLGDYPLPRLLRAPVQEGVKALGQGLWFLKDFPSLSAYRMIGTHWQVIYVGSAESPSREHRTEFCQLMFPEPPQIEEIGRVRAWRLQDAASAWLAQGTDLVVAELSRFQPGKLSAPIAFQAPIWINQVFPIPAQVETLLAGKNAKPLRLARRAMKAGYSHHYSHDPAELDLFYRRMYLPYITSRHGALAMPSSYQELLRWFKRGGLVLVERDGQPASGAVSFLSGDTWHSMAGGILDSNPDLLRDGVHVYNTYAEVNVARQLGARWYDMGGSLAQRKNGIFNHKTLWGSNVIPRNRVTSRWTFLSNQLELPLLEHLNQAQLIAERKSDYFGLVLVPSGLPSEEQQALDLESARRDGLSGVFYLSSTGELAAWKSAAHSEASH